MMIKSFFFVTINVNSNWFLLTVVHNGINKKKILRTSLLTIDLYWSVLFTVAVPNWSFPLGLN